MIFINIFKFITSWVLVAHILFILNLIPNTFLLALFILGGSIIYNAFWNEQFLLVWDISAHWLPLLLWISGIFPVEIRFLPVITVAFMYLCFHRFRIKEILQWYKFPKDYVFGGKNQTIFEEKMKLGNRNIINNKSNVSIKNHVYL